MKPCPPCGSGRVNLWTYGAACEGVRKGWPESKIREYLLAETNHYGEEAETEIERAIQRAFLMAGQRKQPLSPWPALNASLRKQVTEEGPGWENLQKRSPIGNCSASEALERLFPDNPLLWAALEICPEQCADTLPMRSWLQVASKMQFIVPNPVTSQVVPTGGHSKRCLTNTGPRRFQVIESDSGTFNEQVAVLWYLAKFAPLCAVVCSGGKSLHGWFYVAGRGDPWSRRFMELAVSLGADKATWTKCQAVRMPGGHRTKNGARQEIIFFDDKAVVNGGGR